MPDEEDKEDLGPPEFLGWLLLVRLKDQSGDQISRSKFLKLCCIADRYLLEELDYDIGLPRYWYMYGELANQHEFSGRFYNAPSAIGYEGQQYLPKKRIHRSDFDVSDKEIRLVNAAVEWTVRNFGRENVENIKKHQYSEQAPNAFIQKYSELRWALKNIDLGTQQRLEKYLDGPESNEEYITGLLDEMIEAYPEEERDRYDEIRSIYLRWDDTMRLMLEKSGDYGEIEEFLDKFITVLSQVVLRFEYNRNIPEERFKQWEGTAAETKAEFTTTLREKRSELLERRERSTELDSVSEAYTESINAEITRILAGE